MLFLIFFLRIMKLKSFENTYKGRKDYKREEKKRLMLRAQM